MPKLFRWAEHPEVGAFVVREYSSHGSPDLARLIQDQFGVTLSPNSIRSFFFHEIRRRQGAPLPEPVATLPEAGTRFPDQRPPWTEADAAELYEMAMQEGERHEATFPGQTTLTVDLNTKGEGQRPVGICFWSDWQIGTRGVMLRKLREDAETIRDTDGLQVFVLGDLVQNLNQRKHPSSLHECTLPDPRDQEACAKYILSMTKHKILGMVTGNHEENSKQASGLTLTERWAKELNVPYLWHGAKVNVHLGDQVYKIGVRHKFVGESSISTTNAQRRIHTQLWPDCDVIAMGDKHFNDLQKVGKPLGDTIWLRTGSYQGHDDFGQSIAGYKGSWGVASVILFPDEKRVLGFYGKDFAKALEVLADQRRRYER